LRTLLKSSKEYVAGAAGCGASVGAGAGSGAGPPHAQSRPIAPPNSKPEINFMTRPAI
jgi:hypothetical protein